MVKASTKFLSNPKKQSPTVSSNIIRKLRLSISFESYVVYHMKYIYLYNIVCMQHIDSVCVCVYEQTHLCFMHVHIPYYVS